MATAATETSKNYIGGEWVDATGARRSTRRTRRRARRSAPSRARPRRRRPRGRGRQEAYEGWRLTPAPKRGEILFRVGQLLVERKEELTELMAREMGKVIAEARGDVQEAIDMTYYMAGEGRRLFGQTTPSEMPDKFQMCVREPIGVVGAITPWNFPMAIPTWKIVPALIAGNTVVFKPAARHAAARPALRRDPRRGRPARRRASTSSTATARRSASASSSTPTSR